MRLISSCLIFTILLILYSPVAKGIPRFSSEEAQATQGITVPPDYEDVNSKARKTEIFKKILDDSGYDTKLRPPNKDNGTGPTIIDVSFHIRAIENIDDVKMQYSVQATFRQEWVDPRLRYSHLIKRNVKFLQLVLKDRIWSPDTFFSNEKEGKIHQLMTPNIFSRVYPDGRVMQSYRITMLLSCPMDLRAYPLDEQTCPVQMASYGWTTDDLQLRWKKEVPVSMARDFSMPRFAMQDYQLTECLSKTSTGNYSCLRMGIGFKREFGFYLIQIYIPCSMVSIVSWVTFWLEPSAVEARVSLGVTTILAIVTQTYGINQSAPPSSYVKAMDVWTAFCQAMVFGALLEFALVNYIIHRRVLKQSKYQVPFDEDAEDAKVRSEGASEERRLTIALGKAKKVDLLARVIFPLSFAIFNIAYWGHYLNYVALIIE